MQRTVQEKDLENWQQFEDEVKELRAQYTQHGRLLFRGLSDSRWELTTTLERAGCERMLLSKYYELVTARIKPAVETFTGTQWRLPVYGNRILQQFRDPELFWLNRFPSPDLYRYLIYLRHHGFPSPLLDWSYSPYVAAFFAFRRSAAVEKRSIYVYCERPTPNGTIGGTVGEPTIRPIGPYIRSHPRHFRQQSDYTICGARDQGGDWYFDFHASAVGARGRQSFVWKFNLPSSERTGVLRLLDDYNLNAFSLFDSEESLLEMLWVREKVLLNTA